MKKVWKITLLIMITMIIGSSGCKKNSTPADTAATDAVINTMTDQLLAEMDSKEAYAGTPEAAIYMDDDGLSPAFLVNETDLDGNDGNRKNIRLHTFIKCLRELSLSETQLGEIKASLRNYSACNDQAIKRAKAIYQELHTIYKQKYKRIYEAYLAGTLTEREFKKQVDELRIAFKHELRRLHLKENLAGAFGKCLKVFLRELKSELTERQWNAFTECYRRKV